MRENRKKGHFTKNAVFQLLKNSREIYEKCKNTLL